MGSDRIDKTRTGSDRINKTWIGLRPIDKTRTRSEKLRIDMNSCQNSQVTSHNQSFSIKIKLPSFAAQALNVTLNVVRCIFPLASSFFFFIFIGDTSDPSSFILTVSLFLLSFTFRFRFRGLKLCRLMTLPKKAFHQNFLYGINMNFKVILLFSKQPYLSYRDLGRLGTPVEHRSFTKKNHF